MAIPKNVEIAFNEITKPDWVRVLYWTPGTTVPYGQVMAPSGGKSSRPLMRALNAGTTGASEPDWNSVNVGGSVQDGTVTWLRTDATPQAKNLTEAKSVDGLNIHDNYYHRAWAQGQQGYAFTFTSSPSEGPYQRVVNVNLHDNVVADVGSGINASGRDTANDINAQASLLALNTEPYTISPDATSLSVSVNGTTESASIPPGVYSAADLASAIGTQLAPALACALPDATGKVSSLILRATTGDGATCTRTGKSQGAGTSLQIVDTPGNAYSALGFQVGDTACAAIIRVPVPITGADC